MYQMQPSRVDNKLFNPRSGFDAGRGKLVFGFWYTFKVVFFLTAIPWPSFLKVIILRIFGARVGVNVYIKPRVNIHFPWKLEIGNHVWIGEEVVICNFEKVKIGNNCCISQRAFICSGNHNYKVINMAYQNSPITIEDGCWVGAMAFVGPGVIVEVDSVLTAGSFALRRTVAGMVHSGNPCVPKRARWPKAI